MSHNAIRAAVAGIVVVAVLATAPTGQSLSGGGSVGPLSDKPRFNAPFSARTTLSVIQRTSSGRQLLQRTVTTNHFRDSHGRVRIEYVVATDSGDGRAMVLLVPNPYAPTERLFLIDDVEKLIERVDFSSFQRSFNASIAFSIPTGLRPGVRTSRASWFTVFPAENVHTPENSGSGDHLGSRTIAGLEVTGVRFTANLSGAVDERWESADLGVVVFARHVDSRAEIEYRLNDVRRDEPDQKLFLMPAEYRYNHNPTLVWESPSAELLRLGLPLK